MIGPDGAAAPSPRAGEGGSRGTRETDEGDPTAKIRSTPKLARSLRTRSTDAEKKLWRLLRSRRLAELKWRRQAPIGDYIVDFLCFEHRLIVECDGSGHAGSKRDEIRDAWLRTQGFTVVRFWNHEVIQNPLSVTDTILARAGLPF